MDNMTQASQMTSRQADPDDVGVVELFIIFAKHKRMLLVLPVVAMCLAALIGLLLPSIFKSSTTLLPPQQAQSGAMALLSQLGGVGSMAAGAAGLKNPSDLYVGMVTSRTVMDKLIRKFELTKVYDVDSMEKARKKLEQNTAVSVGKDGLITIEVEDKNKTLVAPLANGYVDELLALTKTLAVTEAAQRRLFFEQQLEKAKDNLARAEISLKQGFEKSGVVSVDGESRAIVETMGRMRAQISAKEVQIASMRAFVTASNPEYKRAAEELTSLRSELARLENGRPGRIVGNGSGGNDRSVAGLASIKLLRDVKYFEMLYELLAKQYEVARLDEAKEPNVIQVLDPAIEPEKNAKPKVLIIVMLAGIVAFFVAIMLAFVIESKARLLRAKEGAEKWAELKSHLGR